MHTSFSEVFARLAADEPSRPAISDGERTVARDDLERRTNRLARAFIELGVRRDSLVSIALPNGVEFLEAAIAVWKAGATPQPLSNRLPPPERDAILRLARPSLVVGIAAADAMDVPSVPAGFEAEPSLSPDPLPVVIAASFKAPTSGGSTGLPKLIVATQPAEFEPVERFARLLQLGDDRVQLITGPLHHNGPFLSATCGLLTGHHVIVMPRFDPEGTLELIERQSVNWVYLVPTMMHRIWQLGAEARARFDLSSLQVAIHMAAPCPEWLKRAWIDWLGPSRVIELYAGTEAQAATIISGDEWLRHPGSVGRATIGEIRVVGPTGQDAAPGEVGEVWMRRGANIPSPYRYIGSSPKARGDGWEAIGDLGRLDEQGYLYLTDRLDDVILVGGANVYPAEIEAALDQHPLVRSSCVVGAPDEDLGQVPIAFVQVVDTVSDASLHAHLVQHVAPHKLPRRYERVASPLRDDAGKMRRETYRVLARNQVAHKPGRTT